MVGSRLLHSYAFSLDVYNHSKGLWDRDLPLLKQAGVNTIRVYLANAITRDASVEQLGTNLITVAFLFFFFFFHFIA